SGADPLDKVIDVYICKLRKKIAEATGGARYIETVYGRGYKFEAPPEHEDPAPAQPARRVPPGYAGFGRGVGEARLAV
ncbi:winged helix-turn-helix domain-containing protein, partial [Azospirillum brasilense]